MLTVKEASRIAGVSIRTLHHYDGIGLLKPSERSAAGYRLYSTTDMQRLQQILLYRELEFSLADIRRIMDASDFDKKRALEQQIELLELRRERIDALIGLAQSLAREDVRNMSFEAFDTSKIDEYAAQAKASWGATKEWDDYKKKSAGRTREDEIDLGKQMMELFVPFGQMAATGVEPTSREAKAQARQIQDYISQHFYECSTEVFAQLGKAYGAGGEFTHNIDAAAGPGSAAFAAKAVAALCAEEQNSK